MIQLLGLDFLKGKSLAIACSGGSDSMAALDFLKNKHSVEVIYIHHSSPTCHLGEKIVLDYCEKHSIKCNHFVISGTTPPKCSKEEFWRNQRYEIFRTLDKVPVITAHHLDDVLETWIFTSCHGEPKTIPFRNRNVIRPFLLCKKKVLLDWCVRKNVPFVDDPYNQEEVYMRNYIRKNIVNHVLHINPGICKNLKKKVLVQYEKDEQETNLSGSKKIS